MLRSIHKFETSAERMALILGVNIPWGITKRSISLIYNNSLSIKQYDVHNIRNAKWRYYDEGHKIWIAQPKWSIFGLIVLTRDSHRFCLKLRRGSIVCVCFFSCCLAKMSTRFFSKRPYIYIYARLRRKTKMESLRIVCLYSKEALHGVSDRQSQN